MIENELELIENLFDDLKNAGNLSLIKDGIINIEKYKNSKI